MRAVCTASPRPTGRRGRPHLENPGGGAPSHQGSACADSPGTSALSACILSTRTSVLGPGPHVMVCRVTGGLCREHVSCTRVQNVCGGSSLAPLLPPRACDSSLGGPCPGMHPRYAWGGRAGRCLGTQPSPDVDMRPGCPLEYLLSHGAEVAGHPLPGPHPAAAARPDSWAFSCPFPSSPLISSPRAGQPQAPCAPATGPGVPGHPRLLPVAQVQLVLSEGCGGVRSRLLQGADGQHGWGCTGLGLLPGEAARDCDPGEQLTPCGVAEGAEVTLLGRGLSPGAKAGGRSAVVSPSETNPVQPSSGPSQAPSTGPDVPGIGRGVPPCHIALLQATNATAARPLPSSEEALPARGADGTSRSVSSSQQTCCSPRGEGPPPHGLPPAPPPSRVRSAAFTGASRLSWGLTPLGRRI